MFKPKRIIPVLCCASIILSLWYVYNNILILDDYHPAYIEVSENIKSTDVPQDNTDTKEQGNTQSTVPTKGWHIYINLDEYTMYVYKNAQLIKTYPVSGGKPSTPSPLGTWRIIGKDTWGEGFGGAWMAFNVPWGKYGIHGTVYPWFIGKSNASKGCIRMNNKDVRELYKLVPHGATVEIAHKNPVFRTLKSGDIGSDVVAIQKALKKLGYYHGSANGKFGKAVQTSIIKFQKDYKLYGKGVVNRKTFDLLINKSSEQDISKSQDSSS